MVIVCVFMVMVIFHLFLCVFYENKCISNVLDPSVICV